MLSLLCPIQLTFSIRVSHRSMPCPLSDKYGRDFAKIVPERTSSKNFTLSKSSKLSYVSSWSDEIADISCTLLAIVSSKNKSHGVHGRLNCGRDEHGSSPVKRQRNVSLWFQICNDEIDTPSRLTDPLLPHIPQWNSPQKACNFSVLLEPISHKRRDNHILTESCISCHIKRNGDVSNRCILSFYISGPN